MIHWAFSNGHSDVTGESLEALEEQGEFYLNSFLTARKSAFRETLLLLFTKLA